MDTYPIYKESIRTGMIVKFVGIERGVVMEVGSSSYSVGHISDSWYRHTDKTVWKDCSAERLRDNTESLKGSVESLDLFESLTLSNGFYKEATITKVPNGYVMTSHSGHQIFIKENTKETL